MAYVHVPIWGWVAVAVGLAVLLFVDLVASSRRNRPVRMSEAAGWTLVAVLLAVGFGALLAITSGGTPAGQFFAGWLTEYSLSLDNLLVFVILISRSPVPARLHGRVVLAGIGIAVVLRGIVIGVGAAALHRFGWLEFLFAGFLLYTAAQVARRGAGPQVAAGPEAGRLTGARSPASSGERGTAGGTPAASRATAMADGATPMAGGATPLGDSATAQEPPPGIGTRLAARLTRGHAAGPVLTLVIALGVTDVMFAVDSIPAIFGLTRDPFLVFTANVFALLGLRHLYFLVAGLLARLAYLQAGLCIILAFIGVKLFGEALHNSGVTRIGPVPVPQVNALLSLVIIALVLTVTALASVLATRRRARRAEPLGPPPEAGGAELARHRASVGQGTPQPARSDGSAGAGGLSRPG
jgi:tellurite resistance protein TerC